MKPKILFIHASADLYGSDYVLLNLLKDLKTEAFGLLVMLPYKGRLCEELDKLNIEYLISNIPVLRRSIFNVFGILSFAYSTFKHLFLIKKLLSQYNIDIIHTNTSAIWIGGFASKLFNKKHIWQVMELVEKPFLVSYIMRKIVGVFSTKVYAISTAVQVFFLKVNKSKESKFDVLYHGVDLTVYNPERCKGSEIRELLGVSPETLLVGMAGRINGWKGHDVFVQSIPIVLSRYPEGVKFVMLGDSFQGQEHYQNDLTKHIGGLNLGNSLTFLGFQDDFQDWLHAMDIFVLPSTMAEPNATVTIGAMSLAKPVIGTSIGGTVESIIDDVTGFLVPPKDANAIANRIIYLAGNKHRLNEMGDKARTRALQYFSAKKYSSTIISSYLN